MSESIQKLLEVNFLKSKSYEEINELFRELHKKNESLQSQLEGANALIRVYREESNELDDYFEYRHESERDKGVVMTFLDNITEFYRSRL